MYVFMSEAMCIAELVCEAAPSVTADYKWQAKQSHSIPIHIYIYIRIYINIHICIYIYNFIYQRQYA